MTSIKRESYYKNRITETGEFPSRTRRKLGSSKEVNRDSKRSYKEIV